jgi:tetraacyldisaccharide 4'-kinase
MALARGPVRLPVPVWSVGSPSARGPGRTSTVRWLADALAARGHRVGIAVRGYRRAGAGTGLSWRSCEASDLGDEGALCARDGHLVAAGDRVDAARALVEAGATAIVLDDAWQDRRVHRDVDLVVIDARFPRAGGLIPAGERRSLRARPSAGIVVHHADDPAATPIEGVRARRLVGRWHRGDAPADAPARVAAVLGVARPADALASLEVSVARWRVLPDHAPIDDALADALIAWAGDLPIACTAKDAVRLPEALRARAYWRDLRVRIDDPPAAWFEPR